jgi:hypothetical protein
LLDPCGEGLVQRLHLPGLLRGHQLGAQDREQVLLDDRERRAIVAEVAADGRADEDSQRCAYDHEELAHHITGLATPRMDAGARDEADHGVPAIQAVGMRRHDEVVVGRNDTRRDRRGEAGARACGQAKPTLPATNTSRPRSSMIACGTPATIFPKTIPSG